MGGGGEDVRGNDGETTAGQVYSTLTLCRLKSITLLALRVNHL